MNVCFTHQKVLLNLFIHPVQGLLSVGHGHLGIFVFPGPGGKLVRADVFVTQAQRSQGCIGKILEQKVDCSSLPHKKQVPTWVIHSVLKTFEQCPILSAIFLANI